jgi:hypothetical protein
MGYIRCLKNTAFKVFGLFPKQSFSLISKAKLMRVMFIIGWLLVFLAGVIFHFGPGQEKLKLDQISATLKQARQSAAENEWALAVDQFDQALAMLPDDRKRDQYVVRLEKAKAQMLAAQLPDANEALTGLLEEVEASDAADEQLKADTRVALANSQYYLTWLMRLEGLPKAEWEKEIESARQNYRIVEERSEALGNEKLVKQTQEDLESAIRLARMDLKDLQGLPLPSQ